MDDLISFLHARLDDDADLARTAGAELGPEWQYDAKHGWVQAAQEGDSIATGSQDFLDPEYGQHIARHDPARVLRAAEGLRGLLQRYEHPEESPDLPDSLNRLTANVERQVLAVAFRYLALPYANHPDYQLEWRP